MMMNFYLMESKIGEFLFLLFIIFLYTPIDT